MTRIDNNIETNIDNNYKKKILKNLWRLDSGELHNPVVTGVTTFKLERSLRSRSNLKISGRFTLKEIDNIKFR